MLTDNDFFFTLYIDKSVSRSSWIVIVRKYASKDNNNNEKTGSNLDC